MTLPVSSTLLTIVPEKLHLLYPKSLAGRFETSGDLRANVEVADPRSLLPARQIDIEEVRELCHVVLRLEQLCAYQQQQYLEPPSPNPSSPRLPPSALKEPMASKRQTLMLSRPKHVPPAYLGPHIRDDMDDDELMAIIESLTTRLENSMATLVSFGVLSGTVLIAVSQAARWHQHHPRCSAGNSNLTRPALTGCRSGV